jgi:glycosyltransferase involved in cell wall biosynthesis
MALSVCFIVGSLGPSGGVRAVVRHATALARDHGMGVCLAVDSRDEGESGELPVVTVEEARGRRFDVAIATWWHNAYALAQVPARRQAYFVQQLEDRVYRDGDVERFGAALTHDLPVHFLTEARWIAELLAELRPAAPCFHVPNGIDKDVFVEAPPPEPGVPLRVLVEGSPHLWFKGIQEAADVIARTDAPLRTTLVTPEPAPDSIRTAFDEVIGPLDHRDMAGVYARTDVLLKLSRVEGVFTPPVEAFHVGATCVVWPVTGHDEVVEHGRNGAVCDFDDLVGTAHWLELLARDRDLLERLRRGALETARSWPAWAAASARFAAAVERIAASDGPPPPDSAQLLADVEAAMTEQRMAQRRLLRERHAVERRLERLESTLAIRAGTRAKRLLASLRR